jgi:hypothetical protein
MTGGSDMPAVLATWRASTHTEAAWTQNPRGKNCAWNFALVAVGQALLQPSSSEELLKASGQSQHQNTLFELHITYRIRNNRPRANEQGSNHTPGVSHSLVSTLTPNTW